jgi:SulP family sulfate permease
MNVTATARKIDLRQFFSVMSMGIVAGAIALPLTISFAILIYSGDLSRYASAGIGMMLFGCLAMQLIVAFSSSMPGLMAGPQDSPAAILGLAAVAISAAMAAAPEVAKFITVVATVMLTSILSGLLFLLMGGFKLSRFIRFIPYPVVGGFIAGTGLLLVRGGLGVMLGTTLDMANLRLLAQSNELWLWLPGTIFGILLLIASRRFSHFLTIPIMLTGAVIIFYVAVGLSGLTMAEVREMGLLLGPFPQGALWRPLNLSLFSLVDWGVVAGQASNIAAAAILSMVGLLLNTSALELIARKDIDMNRELTSTGMANIAGGLAGSSVGFHYLGISAIPLRARVFSRLVGVFAALVTVLALLFGASLLSLIPTPVVGGLLLYVGLSFLVEWLYDAWFQLPKVDYLLVVIILGVVATVGFLAGVGVGIVIAIILFVVNYSRINMVKNTLSGTTYQSNLERPPEHRFLLRRFGEQIHVLQLQGYIFFGTAQGLLTRVYERVQDSQKEPLRHLLLDFQNVTALDSSATFSFVRLKQFAESNSFQIVITELDEVSKTQLARSGLTDQDGVLRFFGSLDYGMEWCEDEILKGEGSNTIIRAASVNAQLRKVFSSPELIARFMEYLEKQEIEPGQVLIRQGDVPDCMYLIDRGKVTAQLEVSDDKAIRLKSMGAGTMIGEAGLYLRETRSATVIANEPSLVYRLSADALKQMEADEPRLASKLHEWVARVLSERLMENNHTLEALLE